MHPSSGFKYQDGTTDPMAALDWAVTQTDGVTFVEGYVTSDIGEQVRIESNLDPVWPPRSRGVPVAGWEGTQFEGTVPAEGYLVVGYASPAGPVEPPVELTAETPLVEEDSCSFEQSLEGGDNETVRALVRSLGEAGPPRDAVPLPTSVDDSTPSFENCEDQTQERPQGETGTQTGNSSSRNQPDLDPWFGAIEDRIGTAQRLSTVADADQARAAIDDVGGIEAVRTLQAQLAADRRHLHQLTERTETLRTDLSGVDVPLATLERLI